MKRRKFFAGIGVVVLVLVLLVSSMDMFSMGNFGAADTVDPVEQALSEQGVTAPDASKIEEEPQVPVDSPAQTPDQSGETSGGQAEDNNTADGQPAASPDTSAEDTEAPQNSPVASGSVAPVTGLAPAVETDAVKPKATQTEADYVDNMVDLLFYAADDVMASGSQVRMNIKLSYNNPNGNYLTGVTIEVPLPVGATYVGSTTYTGASFSYDSQNNKVILTIDQVGGGDESNLDAWGKGREFAFNIVPFPGGSTPNGTTLELEAQLKHKGVLKDTKKDTVKATAELKWKNATQTATPGSVGSIAYDATTLTQDIEIKATTSTARSSAQGTEWATQVNLETLITFPEGVDIVLGAGEQYSDYIVAAGAQSITKVDGVERQYKIVWKPVNNTSPLAAELAAVTKTYTLENLTLDPAKFIPNSSVNIVSVVTGTVKSASFSQDLSNTLNVQLTRANKPADIIWDEINAPSVAKTTSMPWIDAGSSTVTFTLSGFNNKQNGPMQTYQLIDDGYNLSEMYPTSLTTGRYTGVTSDTEHYNIYYTLGSDATLIKLGDYAFGTSSTVNLLTTLGEAKCKTVSSIVYDFTSALSGQVLAGFKASASPHVTFTINHPVPENTQTISNRATIKYSYDYGNPVQTKTDSHSASASVQYKWDLQPTVELNKTASNKTSTNGFNYPGDTIEYTLTVESTGTEPLVNPYVKDVMSEYLDPASFSLVSVAVTSGTNITTEDGSPLSTYAGTGGTDTIGGVDHPTRSWAFKGALPAGSTITIKYTVRVKDATDNKIDGTPIPNEGLKLRNDFYVYSRTTPGTGPGGGGTVKEGDGYAEIVVRKEVPMVGIQKYARKLSQPEEENTQDLRGLIVGDQVLFTVYMKNLQYKEGGSNTMRGVDITDPVVMDILPEGFGNVTSISENGTYDPTTRKVTWNLSGTIVPGKQVMLTFVAEVLSSFPLPAQSSSTEVYNNAAVFIGNEEYRYDFSNSNLWGKNIASMADWGSGVPGVQNDCKLQVMRTQYNAGIIKTVTYPAGRTTFAKPGDTLTYAITVTNNSPASVDSLPLGLVMDKLPKNQTFGSVTSVTASSGESPTAVATTTPQADGTTMIRFSLNNGGYSLPSVNNTAVTLRIVFTATVNANALDGQPITGITETNYTAFFADAALPIGILNGDRIQEGEGWDGVASTDRVENKCDVKVMGDAIWPGIWKEYSGQQGIVQPGADIDWKITIGNYAPNTSNTDPSLGATMNIVNPTVVDILPDGFVYKAGTAQYNGAAIADPTITTDTNGRQILTWNLTATLQRGPASSNRTGALTFQSTTKVGFYGTTYNDAYMLPNAAFADTCVWPSVAGMTIADYGNTGSTNAVHYPCKTDVYGDVAVSSNKTVTGTDKLLGTSQTAGSLQTIELCPGSEFTYTLNVKNEGEYEFGNIVLIDRLPAAGDKGVNVDVLRDSEWAPIFKSAQATGAEITFKSNDTAISAADYQSDAGWSSDPTGAKLIRIDFKDTAIEKNESVTAAITCEVPQGVSKGEIAWNSFGFNVYAVKRRTSNDIELNVPGEPAKVGVKVWNNRIGNTVWHDADGNGAMNGGEKGIDGITVNLFKASEYGQGGASPVKTTQTANGGKYEFTVIKPDDYIVEFVKPADGALLFPGDQYGYKYDWTVQNFPTAGPMDNDEDVDSDANPNTGATLSFAVTKDTDNLFIDAGLLASVNNRIGDTIWFDKDGDGKMGPDEKGVEGLGVYLWRAGDYGDSTKQPVDSMQTDANGNYLFTDIQPGKYVVQFTKPQDGTVLTGIGETGGYAYAWTTQSPVAPMDQDQGMDSDANAQGATKEFTVLYDTNNLCIDAGFLGKLNNLIGDTVWFDKDQNGKMDNGEYGISELDVQLWRAADYGDSTKQPVATETTDTDGIYRFSDIPEGEYIIQFHLPEDGRVLTGDYGYKYSWTTPGTGSDPMQLGQTDESDADPTTGATKPFTVYYNTQNLNLDAGVKGEMDNIIGDFFWLDDGNGRQDDGEPGINGVKVELLKVELLTGQNVPVDETVTVNHPVTNEPGYYFFEDLEPGGYRVRFTRPVDGTEIEGVKTGYAFTELNANGVPDTKDSDGIFGTDNTAAAADTDIITVEWNTRDLTNDCGIIRVLKNRIGDYVWHDKNYNGIQDDDGFLGILNPSGINDVLVELYAVDQNNQPVGAPVMSMYTATKNLSGPGYYLFEDIWPGNYIIKFTAPQGYCFTKPNTGDGTDDSKVIDLVNGYTHAFVVTWDTDDLTFDAGVFKPASIGDYVWEDLDYDGTQDIQNEPPIENVEVRLTQPDGSAVTDVNGNVVDPQFTNNIGFYNFQDLFPGDYVVEFVKPGDYEITRQYQGNDRAADSNADPATGKSDTVSLISGQYDETVDCGMFRYAALGDYVWLDDATTIPDGIQDPIVEKGIQGVRVTLYDGGGNALKDMVTDADGFYLFDKLVPGEYVVHFEEVEDHAFSPRYQGGDTALDSDADVNTGMSGKVTLASGETNLTIDAGLYPFVIPPTETIPYDTPSIPVTPTPTPTEINPPTETIPYDNPSIILPTPTPDGATPTPTSTPEPGLPKTGEDFTGWIIAGIAILGMGIILYIVYARARKARKNTR